MTQKQIFSGTRAKTYASRPQWTEEHVAKILEQAKLPTNPIIIDLGSGTGQFTKFLLNLVNDATVYAVEPSKDMRLQAEKKLDDYPNFYSIAAGASNFANKIRSKADFIVASQAAHWWSPPRLSAENERVVTDNIRSVSTAKTFIAYAYYNLGFSDNVSEIGEDIHRILNESLASYSRNQTELSDANAFKADKFSNQIEGISTQDDELTPMSHDKASFFEWLQSYSFVDDGALNDGTVLKQKLEDAFNKHVNNKGNVTIPIFAQTHMGTAPKP